MTFVGKRKRIESGWRKKKNLVLVDGVDDAVVVQDDDIRMAPVERDVPDGARPAQPLGRQLLRQFLGEWRVLAAEDVVLDDLVVGVGHHQHGGCRMEGQRRRVALVARQRRMDGQRL